MDRDVLDEVRIGPMTRFQVMAVMVCVVMNMLDGFDVLALAFAGPSLSAEWKLSGTQLGFLLSAGLFGMAAGSIFIAPAADKFGRRKLILLCIPTIGVGMILSAFAQNPTQLLVLRVITGLGIGTILPSINVITAEYCSNRWRSAAISLVSSGYPIGATLGGLVAGELVALYGWRSIFAFGGIATTILLPVAMRGLPESIDFLVTRRPDNALTALNGILSRMGREVLTEMPKIVHHDRTTTGRGWATLFTAPILSRTLALCAAWLMVMFSVYFVLSWTPKLVVAAGMSAQEGVRTGVWLNVGGIFGGTLFGLLSLKIGMRSLLCLYFLITAALFACLGVYVASPSSLMLIAIIAGAGGFGCTVGMYALTPALFPAACRTTAMGLSMGVGRMGAVLAPIVAGALLDRAWTPPALYLLFAAPLLIGIVAVLFVRQNTDSRSLAGVATQS